MAWVNTSDDESGLSGRKLTAVAGGNRMSGREKHQPMCEEYDTDSDEEGGSFAKPQDIYHRCGHERSPLIRPRRSDDVLSSMSSIDQAPMRYGAVTRRTSTIQEESKSNYKLRSGSVMFFLLIMVSVIALTAAANLNTDGQRMQVEPKHVLVYIMVLMVVFIVWTSYAVLPQKFQYSSQHNGALIPSHLLTGVGIFGTVCATTQMLLFVDFVKCRRHVGNLSVVYGIYPFLKSFFVYFQIYFFYKLSRDGIRDRKLPGGNFLVMVTLATNMCIWWSAFLNDASSDPKLKGVSWLNHYYYYGINGYDPCANATIRSPQIQQLHSIVVDLQPYIATFSMEYALLASGLLLHIWMAIKAPLSMQTHRSEQQYWTLWRLGFILGLLCIPTLFTAYLSELSSAKISAGKAVLHGCKGIIYLFLVVLCRYCTILLNKGSGFVKRVRPMQLEVILLGISFFGFPVLDISSLFAVVSEFGNFPISEIVWHGIAYVAELVAVSLQFLFIKKAYEHKLPEVASVKVRKSARLIRQFSSFAVVVNLGYWAAKTYELRKPDSHPNITEQFFGSYAWFAVMHVAYPLCIFFQFHVATCYADVVCIFSQFGDFANPIQNSGNY